MMAFLSVPSGSMGLVKQFNNAISQGLFCLCQRSMLTQDRFVCSSFFISAPVGETRPVDLTGEPSVGNRVLWIDQYLRPYLRIFRVHRNKITPTIPGDSNSFCQLVCRFTSKTLESFLRPIKGRSAQSCYVAPEISQAQSVMRFFDFFCIRMFFKNKMERWQQLIFWCFPKGLSINVLLQDFKKHLQTVLLVCIPPVTTQKIFSISRVVKSLCSSLPVKKSALIKVLGSPTICRGIIHIPNVAVRPTDPLACVCLT